MNLTMKTSAYLLLLLFVLRSCSLFDFNSSGATQTDSEDIITVEEGKTATLSAFDATVTFVDKSEDSRCPVDVECVWAGRATVLLSLSVSDQPPTSFTLTLGEAPEQSLDVDGYPVIDMLGFQITLLDLRPYPDTNIPEPGPSIIDLRVEQR